MRFLLILLLPILAISQEAETVKDFKFSNESELALLQTTGNAEVETYNLKTLSAWRKTKRVYTLSGHYTLGYAEETNATTGEASKAETARNWDVKLKYEQIMSKHFNGFVAAQTEGDDFAGIARRQNYDFGAKYTFTETEKSTTFTELGLRYTEEFRTVEDDEGQDKFIFNKGRVYIETVYKKSKEMTLKLWVEYLPNFTRSNDYIITYEPSISFVLSEIFSLKTAYRNIYDNEPNVEGNERTDTLFTTSVLAKF